MVYYGLLLFFVLEYVRPSNYLPALNPLHLNSLVPLAVFCGSVFTKKVKISDVLRSPNSRWIMFLLFLIVISGLTCDVKTYALDVFIMVLGYFFMFVILKKEIYDFERFKGVLKTLIIVHLAVGALTPSMFSGDGQRHYIASGSFLGDGNDFALSVNIAIPFCLFLMLESKAVRKKMFYAGVLVALVLAVVVTQSRGGVIALACLGLYFWLRSDQKIWGAIGIAFIVIIILFYGPPELSKRMETLTGEQLDGSAQGRLLAWEAAGNMAADHPILGVGAGHFPVKYGVEYRPEGYGENEIPWQTAHSAYFLLLGELGIPGIIFLLMIIFTNFIAGERTLREMNAHRTESNVTYKHLVISLNASLVAFAVGGAFLSAAYYPHIYLLAALMECGRDLCKKSLMSAAGTHRSEEEVPLVYRGVPV
jgi:putative inorganic carbon (hco3(-)) transporter